MATTRGYGTKSNYTPELLEECLVKVRSEQITAHAASKHYKIPINTIKNKLHNKHMEKFGRPQALTYEDEQTIVKHIKNVTDIGILLTTFDVKLLIQHYLNVNNRNVKVFTNNCPGFEWCKNFITRHPALKCQLNSKIKEKSPLLSEKLRKFYETLQLELVNVSPDNIYGMFEVGFESDPCMDNVIFRRNGRNHIRNDFSSKTSDYTAVICGSASGKIIPTYFIVKGSGKRPKWLFNAPPGSGMITTGNGWLDLVSFDDWCEKLFLPVVSKSDGKKVLVCEYSSAHVSVNVWNLCEENNVKVVCLPPRCMGLMAHSPGYFEGLKTAWKSALANWSGSGDRKRLNFRNHFSELFNMATMEMGDGQSSSVFMKIFKNAGIYPLDPRVGLIRYRRSGQIKEPQIKIPVKIDENKSYVSTVPTIRDKEKIAVKIEETKPTVNQTTLDKEKVTQNNTTKRKIESDNESVKKIKHENTCLEINTKIINENFSKLDGRGLLLMSIGDFIIYTNHGKYFPGQIIQLGKSYVVGIMVKTKGSGWTLSSEGDSIAVASNDVVYKIDSDKIQMVNPGVFVIEDDLLEMEWGFI